jgi:hypothetical protein
MKKVESDDLRPEYRREELGKGIRGKYLKSYRKGTNVVLLSPDVAKVFPNEDAVNNALRSLMDIARRTTNLKRASSDDKERWEHTAKDEVDLK